jgi:hypothetical protein
METESKVVMILLLFARGKAVALPILEGDANKAAGLSHFIALTDCQPCLAQLSIKIGASLQLYHQSHPFQKSIVIFAYK